MQKKLALFFFLLWLQKVNLLRSIEKYVFFVNDNDWLHNAKCEILAQFTRFDINIHAQGYVYLNRALLGTVLLPN